MFDALLERMSEGAALFVPGALFLVGGIALLIAVVVKLLNHVRMRTVGVTVQGEVTGFDVRRYNKDKIHYSPIVKYTDEEGQKHTFKVPRGSYPSLQRMLFKPGQKVRVRYIPGRRNSPVMDSMLNHVLELTQYVFFGTLLTGIGSLFIALHKIFY